MGMAITRPDGVKYKSYILAFAILLSTLMQTQLIRQSLLCNVPG